MKANQSRRQFESRARDALDLGPAAEAQRKKVVDPLRRGVFVVPATITSLGLLAGFYSLISSINAHFELAAVMIAVAFICDGLDGRVARALAIIEPVRRRVGQPLGRGRLWRRAGGPRLYMGAQAAGRACDGHQRTLRGVRGAAAGAIQHPDRQHRQAPLRRIAGSRRSRADRRHARSHTAISN